MKGSIKGSCKGYVRVLGLGIGGLILDGRFEAGSIDVYSVSEVLIGP